MKLNVKFISELNDNTKRYIKDIGDFEPMTLEEEKEVFRQYNETDDVIKKKMLKKMIVESNTKFVIATAKQYQTTKLDINDIISEGNYGLIKAIDKFDYNKNVKFITYAVWWINQAIKKHIQDNGLEIRIPTNVKNRYDGINNGELPHTISLETKIGDDDLSLNDVIYDADSKDLITKFEDSGDISNELYDVISNLDEREKKVIAYYFGMTDLGELNLKQISNLLELSTERIRQLKDQALVKLRCNAMELKQYLYNN